MSAQRQDAMIDLALSTPTKLRSTRNTGSTNAIATATTSFSMKSK